MKSRYCCNQPASGITACKELLPAVECFAGLQKDRKPTAVPVAAATAASAPAAVPVDPAPKVRLADPHTYDPGDGNNRRNSTQSSVNVCTDAGVQGQPCCGFLKIEQQQLSV